MSRLPLLLLATALALLPACTIHVTPTIDVTDDVLKGESPSIVCRGLQPGESARLHAFRVHRKWQEVDDSWQQRPVRLHAWAEFTADRTGAIHVDLQAPIAGTYSTVDQLALLRTGLPSDDPRLHGTWRPHVDPFKALAPDQVRLLLERRGRSLDTRTITLLNARPGLVVQQVARDGMNGTFVRPRATDPLPVVIALHGSEGGHPERAQRFAEQFASRGYAALAVNYFAWADEPIDGVPTAHVEIPIETLVRARDWLAEQPGVDLDRIAIYGVSKGAEFALIAASEYDWINSVIAVVPSDAVWEGYDLDHNGGLGVSSWSLNGHPLPYIPVLPFADAPDGPYRNNAHRYDRSRARHPEEANAARIPVEKTSARVLLLAGDRDEVWASGDMARNVAETLAAAGKGDQVSLCIYPTAGHQIAGTGTFPVWLYNELSTEPNRKDPLAEGAAAADAWKRTLHFLRTMPK